MQIQKFKARITLTSSAPPSLILRRTAQQALTVLQGLPLLTAGKLATLRAGSQLRSPQHTPVNEKGSLREHRVVWARARDSSPGANQENPPGAVQPLRECDQQRCSSEVCEATKPT